MTGQDGGEGLEGRGWAPEAGLRVLAGGRCVARFADEDGPRRLRTANG
jgi:hypothetical protein